MQLFLKKLTSLESWKKMIVRQCIFSYSKLFFRFINCNNNINNATSKILNLPNESTDCNFVTRNWNIVNNQSSSKHRSVEV